jgi:hypothetical protein
MKKNFHQMMKSACYAVLLVFLSLFFSNSAVAGILHFKMTAPKTTLAIGETTTVTVLAWVNDSIAAPANGLDTWQLDLSVNNNGVVGITKTGSVADITLLAPNPDPAWSGWKASTVNTPVTGEVRAVAVNQLVVGAPSYTGVGGFSQIFTFKIEALANGIATYTITDDGEGLFGILADGTQYDNSITPGSVIFDAGSSNNTFTVIPEPTTLAIFAFAGLFAALRRK